MSPKRRTLAEMRKCIGKEIGVTDWLAVEQQVMDQFAAATRDPDWIHVDPGRAAREGPYGGTIAFGFWTLSMLTCWSHEIGMWPVDVVYALNYGLDRVRWINPVPVGSRVRMRCMLQSLDDRADGTVRIHTSNVVEIDGTDRPAMFAEWVGLFVRSPASVIR